MAEYYTKLEADAKFAAMSHTHNIEDLGGTELPASRVAIGSDVSVDFDNAYTVDEAFASTKEQLDGKSPTNHTHSGYATSGHTHTPADIGAAPASHTHDYAAADHTHTPASIGAASESHTHTPASIGAAAESHTHNYAAADHSHSEYSPTTHTHTPASIGAAPSSHSHDYAAPTHSHAQSEITGLTDALGSKANASALTGKADLVDGKVPASQLPSFVDDVLEYAAVSNFPATGETGKIYVATGANKSYRWSGSTYVELSQSVALGETSSTAYRGDRGKTAYDHSQNGTVHVTAAQKTAWDGKAAGDHTHTPASIGAAAASHTHDYAASNHTHSYNNLTDKPTIPAAYSHPASHPASMITGLSDVATSGSYDDLTDKPTIPAAYTHPSSHPASMISGLATVATTGKYSDLTGKPTIPTIPASLPANGGNADTVDNKHASDFATADHTHSYLPLSGGTVTGETNFSGGLVRLKGVQTLFHSGSMIVFGSNSIPTRLAGSAITAAKTITVDSDERLKENIQSVDENACASFIDGIKVKTFNYIGDTDPCMGVIAQELQGTDLAKYFVLDGADGYLGVKAADLVFPLIAAVQMLSKRVEELESKYK